MPRLTSIARQIVTPWQTTIKPSWTIGQIRSALSSHRLGDMCAPSQLFDSMLEDDELPGTLQKRVEATLKSDFRLTLQGEDRELNRRERQTEALFCEMAPDDELLDFFAHFLVLGVGVATLDWDTSGSVWVPKLRNLPTEFLRYDEEERVWKYYAREGEQIVTPGDGKWILIARGQRGWNWGLIRALAVLWLGKQMTIGDWQRYCQKHGLPIIKAKVPMLAHEDEKEGFVDDLDELQSEGVIGLPQGGDGQASYDVELLEAKDTAWESFKANLERADRKIQCMLLGSNIGTEQSDATGGSRAAAETSAKGLDRDKAKADAKTLGRTLQEQLLEPFFQLNFGPNATVPFPFWDTCPEDDAREWATARTQFVDMLGKLPAAGYRLKNVDEIAADYGMELEESEKGPMVDRDPEPAPGGESGGSEDDSK